MMKNQFSRRLTPMDADKNRSKVIVSNLRLSVFICGELVLGLFHQAAGAVLKGQAWRATLIWLLC
jgi:hypothetical protein